MPTPAARSGEGVAQERSPTTSSHFRVTPGRRSGVEVLTRGGLVRYLVLFVIDAKTWRVTSPASLGRLTGPG
jgi:hypothetical protein